ncbi:MAG: hypothetical protein HYU84_16545 [Chloroflexi bacterium]|nr:hypothetical protein [Chloroflexota bacterium]
MFSFPYIVANHRAQSLVAKNTPALSASLRECEADVAGGARESALATTWSANGRRKLYFYEP